MRDRVLALALAALIPISAASASEPWPRRAYNPRPAPDDLELPMPCGGAMTFRRVDVPGEGLLDDRKIVIGGADDRFRFSENVRYEYIAGGMRDGTAGRRHYYIGKYEVSRAQYDAAVGECPTPGAQPQLPAVAVSWFDAVRMAQLYSEWLLKNAADRLPREDGSSGFVRLPTEAEWEFAARGGAGVGDAEFQDVRFPMQDALQRYVWFQGTKSANGKLQPIGLLQPNPLGLHDVLGNADEIVLEPFRLNKLARLHGQAGGYVVKGGNFLTSEGDIRSSYRQEIPHFDKDGPRRLRTVGFRLVIAAPVITSAERMKELKGAWDELPESIAVGSGAEVTDNPVEELDLIIKGTVDTDIRRRLDQLSVTLASNITARNEQRDRAARGVLRLGAFLARKLRDDHRLVETLRTLSTARQQASTDEQTRKAAASRLESAEAVFRENFGYYVDHVIGAAQDYPHDVLQKQLAVFSAEMESRQLHNLVSAATRYLEKVEEYRTSGKVDRDGWLKSITQN